MEDPIYVCGVDSYGYDGNISSFCVMKKQIDSNNTEIVASYSGGCSKKYQEELQKVIEFYKIDPKNIIDFTVK